MLKPWSRGFLVDGLSGSSARRRGAARNTGHMYDGWQGQVVRYGKAQEWCRLMGFHQTKSFRIGLGWDEAMILAIEWSSRMQYIYDTHNDGLLDSPNAPTGGHGGLTRRQRTVRPGWLQEAPPSWSRLGSLGSSPLRDEPRATLAHIQWGGR